LLPALFWLLTDRRQVARVFLTVGICGGFTTFSTFSLDAYLLMDRGELWPAFAYMAGSVVLSIAALFAGLQVIRGSTSLASAISSLDCRERSQAGLR
jgi:CrcB protein